MMIEIQSPTKALLKGFNSKDIEDIKKLLTFKNKSSEFLLKRHYFNKNWRRHDPNGWSNRLEELKANVSYSLLESSGENFYIKPGYIPYLKQNYSFNIHNTIRYPDFKPLPWKKKPEYEPYEYQKIAVQRLMDVRHGCVSLPTGSGKTMCLLLLAQQMGIPTVIVTPSESIFNELLKEFTERLGDKYVGGYGDGKKNINKRITIAIGKSLTMLKPGSKAYEFFAQKQAMLIDESHTFAAEQLEKVCHGVLSEVPYRMFVSATQTRGDGTKELLQSIIGENVLEKTIKECIDEGYLCPLKFTILKTFSKSGKETPDALECKREHFLYNENIADLVARIANASWTSKNQSTLILVEELKQIKMIIDRLNVPYTYVHSASAKKAAEFDLDVADSTERVLAFNRGDAKVLIGTKAISTGTNIYPTHNTINWMGGNSEIVTKQGPMGRSTRKLEISKFKDFHAPKPYSMVYDFDVSNNVILKKQLENRIAFYAESGGEIKYF